MADLSASKIAHAYALMSWKGKSYDEALNLVNSLSCEQLNSITKAADSILIAKQGIEKYLLNGKEIKMEYLTGEETAPDGYFESLKEQIFSNMSEKQVELAIMIILKEIHDNWVLTNSKKYNRDAESNDKRLFQHLPTHMIGLDEVAKDLMFLAPILEVLGINVGEMQKQAWGNFIPSKEIAKTYEKVSMDCFKEDGITSENLSQKLPEIINSYTQLQGDSEIEVARKEYMLDRVTLLAIKLKTIRN